MEIAEATKILDRIQAGKKPIKAKLRGADVTLVPLPGNAFRTLIDMAQPAAKEAIETLNGIGADIRPWPPMGRCDATCTWDTTLHYLMATDDLEVKT